MALKDTVDKFFSSWQKTDFMTMNDILGKANVQSDAFVGAAGGAALIQLFEAVTKAFGPSIHYTLFEEDGTVTAEFRVDGEHADNLDFEPLHVPAVGRPLDMRGCLVVRGDGETVSEGTLYWNWLACLAQLGIRPHMRADLQPA